MKRLTARPSYYERRVKLILICVFFTVASIILGQLTLVHAEEADGYIGTVNLIRTSGLDDCYSVFECNGSTISAKGRYANDRLRKLYIGGYEDSTVSYSMHASSDGAHGHAQNGRLQDRAEI